MGSSISEEDLAREGRQAGGEGLGVVEGRLDQDAVGFGCSVDLHVGVAGEPGAAGGAEAFNVGLAEVLEGPIGGGGEVGANEALVVFVGERLVGDQGDGVFGGGPFAACGLVAQAGDGARLRIEGQQVKCGVSTDAADFCAAEADAGSEGCSSASVSLMAARLLARGSGRVATASSRSWRFSFQLNWTTL